MKSNLFLIEKYERFKQLIIKKINSDTRYPFNPKNIIKTIDDRGFKNLINDSLINNFVNEPIDFKCLDNKFVIWLNIAVRKIKIRFIVLNGEEDSLKKKVIYIKKDITVIDIINR